MSTSLPDPTPVSNLIEGFRWSKTMFTAASLGIYDLLPATAGSLAQTLKLNHDALERLLDGNVGLGLLKNAARPITTSRPRKSICAKTARIR